MKARFTDDEMMAFLNGEWVGTPDSSNVGEATYIADQELLQIGFHGGKPQEGMAYYEYAGITFEMAETFAEADSKGTWVWDYLRRNGYPYRMMTREAKYDEIGQLRDWKVRLQSSRPHKAVAGFWEEFLAASIDPIPEPPGAGAGAAARPRLPKPPPLAAAAKPVASKRGKKKQPAFELSGS